MINMVMEELGDLFELVACCFSESREVRVLGWFLQNVENVCGGSKEYINVRDLWHFERVGKPFNCISDAFCFGAPDTV